MLGRAYLGTLVTTALVSSVAASPALAQAAFNFDLPPQELSKSLRDVARSTGTNVVFDPAEVSGKQAPALKGQFTAQSAIGRLIAGQPLRASSTGTGTWVVSAEGNGPAAAEVAASKGEGAPGSAAATNGSADTQEIVVTAQKQSQRIQDVPVPVTALAADNLSKTNQVRLQDYYSQVPGLSLVAEDFTGAPRVAIRGITTGEFENPTVGVVIDDVPYGSSTSNGFGYVAPEVDPNDLARVEILRGPQGTLYGASSIGGLIKYVTIDPSTDRLGGRFEVGLNGVENESEIGYDMRGFVNVPLAPGLAVRASGYYRRNPGYIDNLATGEKGVNARRSWGGRIAALWRPSGDLTIRLSAIRQLGRLAGSSLVDVRPGLTDFEQSTLAGTGYRRTNVEAYAASVNADLGIVRLVGVSGYNVNSNRYSTDLTPSLGGTVQDIFGVGGAPGTYAIQAKKFSQEVRATVPLTQQITWLIGGFYTNEHSHSDTRIDAEPLPFGGSPQLLSHTADSSTVNELAGFTDLTINFTRRFSLQLGSRESRIRQTETQRSDGLYNTLVGLSDPFQYPLFHANSSAFTYLVTPEYRFSRNLMIYARLASGYRTGGPNLSPQHSVPPTFAPDRTQNYEVGAKGTARKSPQPMLSPTSRLRAARSSNICGRGWRHSPRIPGGSC